MRRLLSLAVVCFVVGIGVALSQPFTRQLQITVSPSIPTISGVTASPGTTFSTPTNPPPAVQIALFAATCSAGNCAGAQFSLASAVTTGCTSGQIAQNPNFTISGNALLDTVALSGNVTENVGIIVSLPSATNTNRCWPLVFTGTAPTITGVSLTGTSFTCGTAGTVGTVNVQGTGNIGGATLSLSGTDAGQFTLSTTSSPANLQVGTSPAGCPRAYNVNLVATLSGATGSPFTQAQTITGSSASASGCISGSICPPCPGGCTWNLAFDDEFSGTTLDTTKWQNFQTADGQPDYSVGGSTLKDCFGQNGMPPSPISVSGGIMTIQTIGSAAAGAAGSYGCNIGTVPQFLGGYMEGRVMADRAGWDAFWICCNPHNTGVFGADDYFEVDIMEAIGGGNRVGTVQPNGHHSIIYGQQTTASGSFHVYGMDWETTTGYRFYLDGTYLSNGNDNPDGCSVASPCNYGPNSVILGNALYYPNNPRDGFQVDWVRVYTHP